MPLECAIYYSEGIVGSNPKGGREDSSNVIEFNHEVYQPVDVQTGAMTGTRVHGSVDLIADLDSALVPLMAALCNNQNLDEVKIVWYRLTGTVEEEYLTMLLRNARVSTIETILPNTKETKKEKMKHLMRLSFAYEDITWTDIDGYEHQDGWKIP